MGIRIATAPGSWGVEPPAGAADPPWQLVLDEIALTGFDGVELGPLGYLPEDPDRLTEALRDRGLELAGGFVMEPFHRAQARERWLDVARRTCRVLAGAGARRVVLIGSLEPERAVTAGRPDAAPRLDARGRRALYAAVRAAADLAGELGLRAAFHPHAGTFVEFGDEIEGLLADTDVDLCVDTGHAAYAGLDPAALLREHAARVSHLHVKDVRADRLALARSRALTFPQAVAAGVFCPLGEGAVDFGAVRAALADAGYDGWATFEQDRLAGDPRARPDAEASLHHLRRLGIGAAAVAEGRA